MKRKKNRDTAVIVTKEMFIRKLRRLADTLERGATFRVQVKGEVVRIPAGASFAVEHEREGGDEELEFQVSWTKKPHRHVSEKSRTSPAEKT